MELSSLFLTIVILSFVSLVFCFFVFIVIEGHPIVLVLSMFSLVSLFLSLVGLSTPTKGFIPPTKEFVEKDNSDHIKFYLPIEEGKNKEIIIDYEKLKDFLNKNNKAVEEK